LNWKKIDIELSKAIKRVCKEIIRTKGRLIRISLTEIARRVGHKSWIENRKAKLPLVTKVIDEMLEPLEDFMLRKLLNAESRYIKELKVPTRQQLIRRASINNTTTANSSRIQNEIDMCLERITQEICS
jgi:hypothetical protein